MRERLHGVAPEGRERLARCTGHLFTAPVCVDFVTPRTARSMTMAVAAARKSRTRMYRGITLMCGLAVLALSTPSHVVAQQRASERLTEVQIVSAIGSDADAGRVMWRVFSHAFAYRGSRHHLLREQVRAAWLPHIEGTELVLVSDAEATALAGRCETYWIIENVRRANEVVSLNLRRQCAGTTLGYIVSFDGQDWRLGPPGLAAGQGWAPGIGSGFYGGPPPSAAATNSCLLVVQASRRGSIATYGIRPGNSLRHRGYQDRCTW
jgi:hypothetical protein